MSMLALLAALPGSGRAHLGLVCPIFHDSTDFQSKSRILVVVYFMADLGTACVVCWHAQLLVDLDYFLPRFPRPYRPLFLIALVVLGSGASWLGYAMFRMWRDRIVEFPDLRRDWDEVCEILRRRGIDPTKAVLIPVLGRPSPSWRAWGESLGFDAATVIRTDTLHVMATPDMILVGCADASSWTQHCDDVTAPPNVSPLEAGRRTRRTVGAAELLSLLPPEVREEWQQLYRLWLRAGLTVLQQARYDQICGRMQEAYDAAEVQQDARRVGRARARLRFLCGLIRETRHPWEPINGLVVLIPWTVPQSEEHVRAAAPLLRADLLAARHALGLHFPVFALVTDIQSMPGFHTFRQCFVAAPSDPGFGAPSALAPAEDPDAMSEWVRGIARTIGSSAVRQQVLELNTDPLEPLAWLPQSWVNYPPSDGWRADSTMYGERYRFYAAADGLMARTGELLARGLPPVEPPEALAGSLMLAGVHLVANGSDPRDQAFGGQILRQLEDHQARVFWTMEAIEADGRRGRLVSLGYRVVALVGAAGFLATAMLVHKHVSP